MNYLVGEITVSDPIEPRGILILAGSHVKTNPKPQKTTAQECAHAIKSPVTVLGAFGGILLFYGRGECLSSAGEIGPGMSTAAVSPAPCARPTPITSTFGIASGSPSFSSQFFPSLVPSNRWRVRNASRACLSRPSAEKGRRQAIASLALGYPALLLSLVVAASAIVKRSPRDVEDSTSTEFGISESSNEAFKNAEYEIASKRDDHTSQTAGEPLRIYRIGDLPRFFRTSLAGHE